MGEYPAGTVSSALFGARNQFVLLRIDGKARRHCAMEETNQAERVHRRRVDFEQEIRAGADSSGECSGCGGIGSVQPDIAGRRPARFRMAAHRPRRCRD